MTPLPSDTATSPATTAVEVLVVGGGAAGLSAALVLGRQRRTVLLVDGGSPRNRVAAEMHMTLSRDGINPSEYLALGRAEVLAHPTVTIVDGTVDRIGGAADAFTATVRGADGSTMQVSARRIALATGLTDLPIAVPGLAERFGSGVYHCPYCHGWESREKTLAVITHEPFDLMLAGYIRDRFSTDVVLCTDGERQIHPDLLTAIVEVGVRIDTRSIDRVDGVDGDLQVHFAHGPALQRQGIFHRAPVRQHSDLAADLGCTLLPNGIVLVDEFQETSVPGVYALGDMATTQGVPDAVTLVNQAAADGVRAAVWMETSMFRSDAGVTFPLRDIAAVALQGPLVVTST